jgi:hypothetical protein
VSRHPVGVIGGTKERFVVVDEIVHFPLVPDVISRREDIDPVAVQVFHDLPGDAETGGGVFAVGDDEVHRPPGHERREKLPDGPAARLADDVPMNRIFMDRRYLA